MQIIYSLFFHYYFETEKLHYMHDSFRAHFKHLRLHVYFLLFFLQYRMHHKLRWTHWGNTILTSFCTRQYLLMHPVSFHLLFHILDFFLFSMHASILRHFASTGWKVAQRTSPLCRRLAFLLCSFWTKGSFRSSLCQSGWCRLWLKKLYSLSIRIYTRWTIA